MTWFDRILVIGAHPDDIEFGCLGYLLKVKDYAQISAYVASLGSKGDPTTGARRRDESREALSVLNLKDLRFREKAGIEAEDFDGIRAELYELIQNNDPNLILCLGPHDTHQEHHHIYQLMISSARRSNSSIMIYGILSNTYNFNPGSLLTSQSIMKKRKRRFGALFPRKTSTT